MGWINQLIGYVTGNGVEVDDNNRLLVNLALTDTPNEIGGVRLYSEVDPGTSTGTPLLASPETDDDYRLRTAHQTMLDVETFNYAAQNTGKHIYRTSTMTTTFTANGALLNTTSVVAATNATSLLTYGYFPFRGATTTLRVDCRIAWNVNAFVTNTTTDWGFFLLATTTPFAPTDGIYFRQNSAGLFGVVNYNGTEVVTGPFSLTSGGTVWQPTPNQKYDFNINVNQGDVEFYLSGTLLALVPNPISWGQPCQSAALPWGIRQAIGASPAGAAQQTLLSEYTVSLSGPVQADPFAVIGNRVYGSYQGLSGGTMGGLATYANSANPSAAVPSNTALTANLPGGLGGQAFETATLAVNTDGIVNSYQVPAGTAAIPGKRLKITGVHLSSFVQAAITGGPVNVMWSLAFGHTAVSMATGEAATTKAPRRIPLANFTQTVTSGQVVSTMVSQPFPAIRFDNPIYVNPGEFIALVKKHVGTTMTAGTFAHSIAFDYGWE